MKTATQEPASQGTEAAQTPEVVVNAIKSGARAEFWETERGRKSKLWLETWGLTVRGRLDTGDQAYVPQMDSEGAGSNRSHPSNVSDALLRFMDVDFVMTMIAQGPRRVAYFCFVTSITTRHMHRPLFRDGTTGEWAHGPEPSEESPLIVAYENDIRNAWEWQWDRFPTVPGEIEYWKAWEVNRNRFLERQLEQVGKFVADELGF
jgi:hypothetical protein